ncbi:MAG TPA: pitrilysin family protein [Halanaerobiales bacterium]|nr:pitrilysin family protein [Halanaerobiales bacterium]HPZ63142.1 pitrilysin family protein [Halanaerobiales bacterium]HQD04396.1 pitrilysin family protein [Halanaerobiales bacterium]
MKEMETFQYYQTDNELDLYICKNKKFKTNLIQMIILCQLNEEDASSNALIPFILYRGSKNYPSSRAFKIELEELYGAELSVSVWKRGEIQLLNFSLEIVNEKYLPTDELLLEKGLALLKDLLLNPLFTEEFFQQEKEFIIKEIKSIINDKYSYSLNRCFQEMCAGEPFSIYKLGRIEDHEKLSRDQVFQQYQEVIKNNRILFFVIGDVDEKRVYEKINNSFNFRHQVVKDYNNTIIINDVKGIKELEERLNVQQGKIVLGFRTGITRKDDLYYPLLMYNGILGAFPHSKLFQNVREKESLAYYASSSLESTKGLLLITAGIDFANYDKTIDIILKELEKMRQGDFTEEEFQWTMKSLINSFESTADNNRGLLAHYLLGVINHKTETIKDSIDELGKVKKEDIIRVGEKLQLDTIYFLNKKVTE